MPARPRTPQTILYVIDSLKFGGAEVLLADLAACCRARGHRVEVAYFTPGPLQERFAALEIPTWRIARGGLATPWPVISLARRMRQLRPDIVHTHLRKSDLAGQLAARLAGVPLRIATIHNADPWRRKRLLAWIDARLTAGCQRRISVSPAVTSYLQRYASGYDETLVTIPNGVDTTRFDPDRDHAERRAQWRLGTTDRIVGIVGRLEPQKDHATFIAAAASVAASDARARFVLVGDGPLRRDIERACNTSGHAERFVFAGLEHDMPAALAAMDLVVFSSRWEGLPIALLEAMAMAKAIVATDVGGVADALSEAGVVVQPGDSAALANAMRRLLADERQARALGRRAREIVCRGYSLAQAHERTLALYADAHAAAVG